MKYKTNKIILITFLSLSLIYCNENPLLPAQIERGRNSIVGKVSIEKLSKFSLKKDTLQVQVDTLGYFFIMNPPVDNKKFISAVQNVELFDGGLRTPIRFCSAVQSISGIKVTFQGSPNPLWNEVITLNIVDSFAIAQYIMPFYKKGMITYDCTLRTDSLHVTLDKYPVQKGDIIRGYLAYKGWKECTFREEDNRIVGRKNHREGYFECKVE
jgi:hypothetical protein